MEILLQSLAKKTKWFILHKWQRDVAGMDFGSYPHTTENKARFTLSI